MNERNGRRKEEEEDKGSEENERIASNHHAAENKQRNKMLVLLRSELHTNEDTPSRKQPNAYVTKANANVLGRGRPR